MLHGKTTILKSRLTRRRGADHLRQVGFVIGLRQKPRIGLELQGLNGQLPAIEADCA